MTSLVTGDGPVNLRLAITGDDGVTFHSREASNQTLRPQLVVTLLNDAYVRPKGATPTRLPPRARLPAVHQREPPARPAARTSRRAARPRSSRASSRSGARTPTARPPISSGSATFDVLERSAVHPGRRGRRARAGVDHGRAPPRRPGRLHRRPAGAHDGARHRQGRRHVDGHGHRAARRRAVRRHPGGRGLDVLGRRRRSTPSTRARSTRAPARSGSWAASSCWTAASSVRPPGVFVP